MLQNELKHRVPPSFLQNFPEGVAVAYALIPQIPSLPEPLKGDIQDAFAGSLRVVWQVLIGVAGIGFLSSLFMAGLPLHNALDEDWTPEAKNSKGSETKVSDAEAVRVMTIDIGTTQSP